MARSSLARHFDLSAFGCTLLDPQAGREWARA